MTISAGFGKLTNRHLCDVIADQLFGMTSTAATVRAYTHASANISIAVALFYGFLNLLFGNGFAHANVHTKHPQLRINVVDV